MSSVVRSVLEARAEIQKYFRSFLVQMKTLKSPFEINWPLPESQYDILLIFQSRLCNYFKTLQNFNFFFFRCEAKGIHPAHDMIRISSASRSYPPHFFSRLQRWTFYFLIFIRKHSENIKKVSIFCHFIYTGQSF